MTEISADAIDRMSRFVRAMAKKPIDDRFMGYEAAEARAIVAELPTPIDPDNAEVRAIVNRHLDGGSYGTDAMFMELLKRGRELSLAETGK